MLWGACAKRHCKSWQTQKNGFPYLAVAWGESVIFLHYRGEVPFSADSLDSCSKILFRGFCVRIQKTFSADSA